MSVRFRLALAVLTWLSLSMAVVLPLMWLVNNRDWGVGLMLLIPPLIYGLLRIGRRLERWARATPPPHSLPPQAR